MTDPVTAAAAELTETERAVLGLGSTTEAAELFGRYAGQALGSSVAAVRFRAGRIDVVWGVELDDGRDVALRAYRQPVDLDALRTTRDAQRTLHAAGFPCPQPLAGPTDVNGQILAAETLMADGVMPDGHDPDHRRLLAEGLAEHIQLLRNHRDLLDRVGPGPAWCQYHNGPWPTPHDSIVNFDSAPEGYAWLDIFARRATTQILAHRDPDRVVGHADWYGGNTAVADGRLVATFDWELVNDAEAVIAGFTAACYAANPTGPGGLSSPEEAATFLQDYDAARGMPTSKAGQRAAAGAVAWILAFNARWQVGLLSHGKADAATIELVSERGDDYLNLAW